MVPMEQKLRDKIIFNTITSGGQRSAYSKDGYNRFTVKELLAPFEQTAALCKMKYLPPFALHGTHRLTNEDAVKTASQYQRLLEVLHQGDFSVEEALSLPYLNDWIAGKMI
jgi:glutathione-regulated potassium-efflux system ancillary protein KefG